MLLEFLDERTLLNCEFPTLINSFWIAYGINRAKMATKLICVEMLIIITEIRNEVKKFQ